MVLLGHFWPFFHPNNLESQNFENMKKLPGYIIILEMCTINGYHMMYGCSNKERDGQNFLSFCAFFLSFYPANKPENQLLGKIKTMHGDIIILHLRTLNDNHMMHGS